MKDPQRLLGESGRSALERSLLAAGRARREREGARERVWAGVVGGAGIVGASGGAKAGAGAGSGAGTGLGSGAGAGAGAGAGLLKMKVLLAGIAIVTAGGGATYVAARSSAEPAPSKQSAVVQAVQSASNAVPSPIPSPVATANAEVIEPQRPNVVAAPKVLPKRSANEVRAVSELREEAALLGDVRSALGSGKPREASALLERARAKYPRSRLAEERDALEIRIATAMGDAQRAAALGRAFVAKYPESPLRPAGIDTTPE